MKTKICIAVATVALFFASAALADDCGNGKDHGKGNPSCGQNNGGNGGGQGNGGSGGQGGNGGNGQGGNGGAGGSSSSSAASSSTSSSSSSSASNSSATGGNASATGGNASAQGGSVSGSGNSTNSNTNVAQGGAGGSASSSNNSSGNSTSVSTSTSYRESAHTAFEVTPLPTVSCFKGAGIGAQGLTFGASISGGRIDENCARLEAARSAAAYGSKIAYCKILLTNKYAKKAGVSLDDCMNERPAVAVPETKPLVQVVPSPAPIVPVTVQPAAVSVPVVPVTLNVTPAVIEKPCTMKKKSKKLGPAGAPSSCKVA